MDIGETVLFLSENSTWKRVFGAINSPQDIILVDGRWRVACAISAFPFIAPKGRLMIHDFSRRWYHSILKFYTKEIEVDELAVLIPKSNVDKRSQGPSASIPSQRCPTLEVSILLCLGVIGLCLYSE